MTINIYFRYSHGEKIWNFLRYDRSNKFLGDNESLSTSLLSPIPLFKWSESKIQSDEIPLSNRSVNDLKFLLILIFSFLSLPKGSNRSF